MQDTRKLIGKCTANIEALLHELYLVAGIETVTADHKKQFDELRSQIEAAQQQLTDLNVQIDAGNVALEQLRSERTGIGNDIERLKIDRGAIERDIARVRKALGEAA